MGCNCSFVLVGLFKLAERRWLADGQPIGVTLSVGVACAHNARVAPAALIDLADRALYQAKAEGRNRVCVAGDAPTQAPQADGMSMPPLPVQ